MNLLQVVPQSNSLHDGVDRQHHNALLWETPLSLCKLQEQGCAPLSMHTSLETPSDISLKTCVRTYTSFLPFAIAFFVFTFTHSPPSHLHTSKSNLPRSDHLQELGVPLPLQCLDALLQAFWSVTLLYLASFLEQNFPRINAAIHEMERDP